MPETLTQSHRAGAVAGQFSNAAGVATGTMWPLGYLTQCVVSQHLLVEDLHSGVHSRVTTDAVVSTGSEVANTHHSVVHAADSRHDLVQLLLGHVRSAHPLHNASTHRLRSHQATSHHIVVPRYPLAAASTCMLPATHHKAPSSTRTFLHCAHSKLLATCTSWHTAY